MIPRKRFNEIDYYRQHTDKLEPHIRGFNVIQLVCLFVSVAATVGHYSLKLDILLLILIWALGMGARAYADGGRLYLVQCVLDQTEGPNAAEHGADESD